MDDDMKGRNANHPKKGASIKVQPIRGLDAIGRIKRNLSNHPRNLCLFTLGINTAYRANEILSLTIGQVRHLQPGDILSVKQSKTNEYRSTVLNSVTVDAIQQWLALHPYQNEENAPLFVSERRRYQSLTVATLNHLVKGWCHEIDLPGNYGSHTLRKTWGYHQRVSNRASVALLMKAFGHSTETQTLEYLYILPFEIHDLYQTLEL